MRDLARGSAEYVGGLSFCIGCCVVKALPQDIELLEVDVPGEQRLPLLISGTVGTKGTYVLKVLRWRNLCKLGGLDEGIEEGGCIRTINGLGKQPIFPAYQK